MKNLATKNKCDFIVFEDGTTRIGYIRLAKLLGVNVVVLKAHIQRNHPTVSSFIGIDEQVTIMVALHFATGSDQVGYKARNFIEDVAVRGIRQYNYDHAGYKRDTNTEVQSLADQLISAGQALKLLKLDE